MLVCGAGDRRRGEGGAIAAASAAEKRSSLTSMLLKKKGKKKALLNGDDSFIYLLFVCWHVCVHAVNPESGCLYFQLARTNQKTAKKKKDLLKRERLIRFCQIWTLIPVSPGDPVWFPPDSARLPFSSEGSLAWAAAGGQGPIQRYWIINK